MDRDQIVRQDFPAARRGYDPAAVQEHLRRVAEAFDRPASTLAEGASARVRAILEAAEASAEQLRAEAGREASGHVERVEASAKEMLAKCDRLKSVAESLTTELEQLRRDSGALRGADETPPEPRNGARSGDEAGARLVALNMALEGTPRDEAGRYLDEHYELAHIEALLDDVYASAGK